MSREWSAASPEARVTGWQTPERHSPPPQLWPQALQWSEDWVRSTQSVPHAVSGAEHVGPPPPVPELADPVPTDELPEGVAAPDVEVGQLPPDADSLHPSR